MLKTSHIQEMKRRYREMYAPKSEELEEHCGVCGEGEGIEEGKPPRKLAQRDIGMECQECGKKFRAKLSTLQYGRTKCPKCKSTDLDFAYGESVEVKEDTDKDEPGTQGDQAEYQKKRKEIAAKFGVKSCSELEGEKKKACYAALDAAHVSDDEEGEEKKEEVEIDEEVTAMDYDRLKRGDIITIDFKSAMSSGKSKFKVTAKNIVGKAKVGKVTLRSVMNPKGVKYYLYKRGNKVSFAQGDMGASVERYTIEQVEIDEKRGSDYQLYHKTFSDAMQHAYQHAEKKGFVVDPKEIDDKVATGPKKPSSGKTNRYILGTNKKKKVHIQVANLDNKKYELNMYIEDARDSVRFLKKLTQNESTQEGAPMSVVKRFLSERREKIQAVEANKALERKVRADYHKMEGDKKRMEKLATKYKIRKDEVQGIIMSEDYETEELDPVNKIAVKKKFKDRKDKDIDNDGDTDSSDKFLHKRRKAISKAIAKEEWEESPINDDRYKLSNAAPHMNIKAKSDMEGPYMYHDSLFYWSPSEQKFWSEDAGGWMEDGEAKDMMYSFMKGLWQGRKGSLPAVDR